VDPDLPRHFLGAEVAVTAPDAAAQRTDATAVLLAALFAGPVAWALNQGVGYAVVKPACAAGVGSVVWSIDAATFALAGVGAWISWRWMRLLSPTAAEDGGSVPDRSYFMAIVAVALNALIALLIVNTLVMQLLSRCQ
jgi:hypothetical protein